MQTRLKVLTLLFLVGFLSLVTKLFFWQVVKGRVLGSEAKGQYQAKEFLSASRGNILASDGTWLVARGKAYLVFAEPPKIKDDLKKISDTLAPYFADDPSDKPRLLTERERIYSLLSRKGVVWVILKQKVSSEIKKKIESLNISGIGFEDKEDRLYPEASMAAQLLGFVGKDGEGNDQGYFGLEGYYNLSLTGKPGFNETEKDAKGIPILIGNSKGVSAVSGVNLLTFIDKTVQKVVENKLLEGIEKYQAAGGVTIVMNPKNGAILAMASFPSYDPGKYYQFGDEFFKNPAISETFEPGSIFKVIVMASAIDLGVVSPDTICDICSGPLKVDKYSIETWNNKYHPDSSMTDVMVNSDNVGMAFVSQKMGADSLYDYLNKFGIGKETGIDLQGEVAPKLRQKGTWNIVDLATASFGQGVATTPIEMVRAVGAIANGGKIVTPHVVARLQGDGWEKKLEMDKEERIISPKAAEEITQMMVAAAEHGEAKWTNLPGFKIAGKTGTAQIPIAGHYDAQKTIASFVGFAPSDNPKFVMFLSLKEPKTSPWASETAAPVWYSITKDLIPYFGIQPE